MKNSTKKLAIAAIAAIIVIISLTAIVAVAAEENEEFNLLVEEELFIKESEKAFIENYRVIVESKHIPVYEGYTYRTSPTETQQSILEAEGVLYADNVEYMMAPCGKNQFGASLYRQTIWYTDANLFVHSLNDGFDCVKGHLHVPYDYQAVAGGIGIKANIIAVFRYGKRIAQLELPVNSNIIHLGDTSKFSIFLANGKTYTIDQETGDYSVIAE